MSIRRSLLAAALAVALCFQAAEAEPFTFQGHVENSGTPLNGSANLRFRVYTAETVGAQIGDEVVANAYPVADGVFSIDLDFGPSLAFDGGGRFLEVEVNGQVLSPRFAILPAPLASSANALRGRAVSGSAPANGNALVWNGAQWAPQAVSGGTTYAAGTGLTLTGTTFSVNFAGSGAANTVARSDHNHYGHVFSGSAAQQALNISQGNSANGSTALFAVAQSASGVTVGVAGVSNSSSGGARGVLGHATADSGEVFGVQGQTDSSTAGARGVFGIASAPSGDVHGVHGRTNSPQGRGVFGLAAANTGFAPGVIGETLSASDTARGVYGLATAASGETKGVIGRSNSNAGIGVLGEVPTTTGNTIGVQGTSASSQGIGVRGIATSATGNTVGVRGDGRIGMVANGTETGLDAVATDSSGQAVGVQAATGSPEGAGVFAMNSAATGDAFGVYAQSNSTGGRAAVGDALSSSGSNIGVLGRTASGGGTGMRAENTAVSGSGNALQVVGNAPSGDSLVVDANGGTTSWAILARSAGANGRALNALLTNNAATSSAVAVYAQVGSANARAGQFINLGGGTAASFTGNVDVSGTLSKGGGSFKIDHPLDPENKFLFHSFVESPDMMNIYNGNIVTGKDGFAMVELPDWFDTLNREFRYQLTVIGSFAQAIIAEEIEGNRFVIQTSAPSVKVSWQVTGVRQDPWAEANRIEVEVDKNAAERGKYLHPEAWGQPLDKRLGIEADDVSGEK